MKEKKNMRYPSKRGIRFLMYFNKAELKASQLHAVEKEPAKNALFLSSVMIFSGTRLACMVAAKDQMNIEIAPEVRSSIAEEWEGDVYQPTTGQSGYAVACDNWVISWIRKRRIRRLRST